MEDLTQVESKLDVANLNIEDVEESEILSTHPFMVLPPFIWITMMGLRDCSPSNVLLKTLKRISDYSESHDNSEVIEEEARKETCTHLLQFLWLAEEEEICQMYLFPPIDNQEATSWSRFKHDQCLNKVTYYPPQHSNHQGPPHTTNQGLNSATILSINKDLFEQYKAIASSSKDSKKKSFNKLCAFCQEYYMEKYKLTNLQKTVRNSSAVPVMGKQG